MVSFVKVCPGCGHMEPEYESVCSACNQFIGMEPSIPKPQQKDVRNTDPGEAAKPEDATAKVTNQNANTAALADSSVSVQKQSVLFLDIQNENHILTIQAGQILGQEYPDSEADVQIPRKIEGVEFVHRWHCRFQYEGLHWTLEALDQAQWGGEFNNPTWINDVLLLPGKKEKVKNGDLIRLSGLYIRIKTVE